ncbi:T9SS type A sorting domain-containing protein [Aestuariivivens sediminis]|uniref:T9SS type A sorting domain-containing protein n=1 Tax=Aestuariivivens sediminis TaxID=2913557 RepID=UPI001F5A9595|nr:T9SS type A sorting domain-containing protein [Aestuariivivens sediminis]
MKTRLLLLALVISMSQLYAQCPGGTPDPGYTCIPDMSFEQALINQGIDTVGALDGQVLTNDINDETELILFNLGISDLTGIEGFTALTRLECRYNSLSTVDLSANTALTYVDLFQNNLTELDVTDLTGLITLAFANNNVSMIDLQYNVDLEVLGAGSNNLGALDVSNNLMLKSITVTSNSIGTLNLSSNQNLQTIFCANNGMTNLTLPVTNTVTRLDCYNNSLSGSLDVSGYPDLDILWCYNNNFSGPLDLSNNTVLRNADIGDNNFSGVTMPDDLDTLFRFVCDNNSIPTLDLTNNNALTTLRCNDANIDNLLLPATVTGAQLDIWCYGNNLTALDVSGLSNLRKLWCYDNDLQEIDVSGNGALILLDCGINPFTAGLNVASNANLQELYCNNNNLTSINLASNGQLQYVGVYNLNNGPFVGLYENDLTEFNVGSNTSLQWINCGGNMNLSNITIPNTPLLTAFYAFGNGLTNLDFLNSNNYDYIQYFDVGNGNLTSINVSDMPSLKAFYCNGNASLSYLNIQNGFNGNLVTMWAHDTNLDCIQVDDVSDANSRDIDDWKSGGASYSTSCPALSLTEQTKESISIYPNPTRHTMSVDLQSDADYRLINVQGQNMLNGRFSSGMNHLDLSALSKGIYFLQLNAFQGNLTQKIIKQ